jgi:NAD(P)H-hydrate epimerase
MGAVILGPGMSQNAETAKFVYAVLALIARSGKPCIVDADALNAISLDVSKFPSNGSKFVLTPHPKELARLMQNTVREIQKDRVTSARTAAAKFGCTVVLKGSRTVVAHADGTVNINPTGNAGMATAGCGDVLSGIIGGLMAQGAPSHEAAVIGVYIHGMAGDMVAADLGEAGIVAGDIESAVPRALLHIRRGAVSHLESQLMGLRRSWHNNENWTPLAKALPYS